MTPPAEAAASKPLAVRLWFVWAFALLGLTGLFLDESWSSSTSVSVLRSSILGIFMMIELALILFGITVAMQRKRIALRFAIGIALLAVPVLAGLPPVLLEMPAEAASGWFVLMAPIGAIISIGLVIGLLRQSSRTYFSEA